MLYIKPCIGGGFLRLKKWCSIEYLVRSSICTFHKRIIGKRASIKSDMIEMRAWDMIILCSSASVKHIPGVCVSHARATELHWIVYSKVRMRLLIIRTIVVR